MRERRWRRVLLAFVPALVWGASAVNAGPGTPHDTVARDATTAGTDAAPSGDDEPAAAASAPAAGQPRKEAAPTTQPPAGLVREPETERAGATAPVAQPRAEEPARTPRRPEDITLTVATWDTAYTAAQRRALFTPFIDETGHQLKTVSHDGDLASLTGERVAAKGWDLVELDARTARQGCENGWLKEIAATDLPASVEGVAAPADYLPGALMPCAAGSAAWSSVVVYDPRAGFEEAPQSITDLFALERFPGKRALPRQAPYVLELALMADGVPPGRVYDVLATPAGQDRAFSRLSAVRHAIVWWDDASRSLAPFSAGGPEAIDDVVMGVAFNGRVFTSAVRARQWLRILWDGQIYRFNYWAIPSAAPNAEAGKRLLRFVSLPERQARLTRWFPYGPVRKSARPLVGQHAEIDLDMADFVPTMRRNMTNTLRFDQAFWAEHGERLKARFAEWLALPRPQVPPDQFVPPTPVKSLRATTMTVR